MSSVSVHFDSAPLEDALAALECVAAVDPEPVRALIDGPVPLFDVQTVFELAVVGGSRSAIRARLVPSRALRAFLFHVSHSS